LPYHLRRVDLKEHALFSESETGYVWYWVPLGGSSQDLLFVDSLHFHLDQFVEAEHDFGEVFCDMYAAFFVQRSFGLNYSYGGSIMIGHNIGVNRPGTKKGA